MCASLGEGTAERYPVKMSRRRRHRYSFWRLLLILTIGIGIGWILHGCVSGNSKLKEPPENPDWITQSFLPKNEYSRPGTRLDEIAGLVVHYVGNPGTSAEQNRNYFASLAETKATYASSHFIIGLNGEIIQNIPLDEVAYCSNNRNNDTLSIECCHPDDTGKFTQETYDSLVKLVIWLQEYYDLSADTVIRHYDVTGKECPRYFVQNPDAWEAFLKEIKQ